MGIVIQEENFSNTMLNLSLDSKDTWHLKNTGTFSGMTAQTINNTISACRFTNIQNMNSYQN